MLHELTDKVIYITGGAHRLGRHLAFAFAEEGAHIVIHHRSSDEEAEATARGVEERGVQALIVKGDYQYPEQLRANVSEAVDTFGHIDVLINNASNYYRTPFLDITPEEWALVIDVNLGAPFLLAREIVDHMVAGGIEGSVINIGDNTGIRPKLNRVHHGIAKGGLAAMTQIVARNIAKYQVRMNCIVPGPILKPVDASDDYWEQVPERVPLKRVGDPSDIARAAIFLATNDFITGAILHVDGGEALGDATHDPE
jgi:NAD(P)-dependent dehydrogenase (short-subunit alcohol dehydrogenase family)